MVDATKGSSVYNIKTKSMLLMLLKVPLSII